ncbi:Tail sheath protein C-terminal domain-containing protein [Acinetobacter pragensis]
MSIQAGIRTPGMYTDVNINTQRTGLPANTHKVLFITADDKVMDQPVAIYDESDAIEKIGTDSIVGRMIKAAVKTNRLVDVQAITLAMNTTDPQAPVPDVDNTTEIIAPLGHTILAVDKTPAIGDETEAWIDHLNFVSDAIEQRPAILVVPFSDIEAATTFAAQAPVETSYRVVAVCYHGASGQEAEISAAMAAALADSSDPALPFNGVNLEGVGAVEDKYKLTFERQEAAMRAGVCIIQTGADGTPEIVRAISTFRKNPDSGMADDIMLDINGALTIDYVRLVMRTAASKERRRKNTGAARRNLRSVFMAEAIKLEKAEILENVTATADQLTVTQDSDDKARANADIPSYWVRGMHVIATTLNVY